MNFRIYLLSLFIAPMIACSEDHEPFVISDCMVQKIEDFKSSPNAKAIIQINSPGEKLFWFQLATIPIDIGEDLYTNDCNWYCNFGCYCIESAHCDEDLLGLPMDTLWHN